MVRNFVTGEMVNWFPSVINMKLTQSLCFSSSNGGDELVDEGFIPVLFLLFHMCIKCMWYKRDLNVFFVSSSLPRGACKLNFWCMTESLWLWGLFVHRESEWHLPKTACKLMLPEQHQLKIFLFMKWMPILFAYTFCWIWDYLWNDLYVPQLGEVAEANSW